MKRISFPAALLAGLLLAGGCDHTPAPPPPPNPYPGLPTAAQPRLPTIQLWIGAEKMTAEMALTEIQERTGMMFRTNVPENEGMIFVLDHPQQASFWMMNCPTPLSAAYIDVEGRILEIHPLNANDTNSVVSAAGNVQFVLETAQGWFDRHHVGAGTLIATEKGPLKKVFLNP